MGKSFIVDQSDIERIKYPAEEIEFIVGQIIRLQNESNRDYSPQIDQAMVTLNDSLKLICKPMIYLQKGDI
jgi:hypothetical protein